MKEEMRLNITYFMICLFVYTRNYMSCRKIINTHSSVCNYLGTLLPSYRTMVHTYILQVRLDWWTPKSHWSWKHL